MAGGSSVETLKKLGIRTIGELAQADPKILELHLKSHGRMLWNFANGIDDSPALSAANVGVAISDGAAIAREIADITIAADSLFELVTLRRIAQGLMRRIHGNYRFVIGFNGTLIGLGVAGVLAPASSAMLHNLSTLGISLRSMTNLLPPAPAAQE